jgi:hypothetical protein
VIFSLRALPLTVRPSSSAFRADIGVVKGSPAARFGVLSPRSRNRFMTLFASGLHRSIHLLPAWRTPPLRNS